MASTAVTSVRSEKLELVEWDIPVTEIHNDSDFSEGLSKLSMNTEIRNRYWENANRYPHQQHQYCGSSNSSPLLDQNQNFTYELDNNQMSSSGLQPVYRHSSTGALNTTDAGFISKTNGIPQQLSNNSPVMLNQRQVFTKVHTKSQSPLLQSQQAATPTQPNLPVVTNNNSNERKSPEILSAQDNIAFDSRRINESQTIKEELLEMKSIFTKLATQTDDITGLPEPVQLALKVIELEAIIQERDKKIENLEEVNTNLRNEIERNHKEYDFQLVKHKKEMKNLKEKLEIKNEPISKRNYVNGNTDRLQIEKLREELKNLKEANEQKTNELNEKNTELEHLVHMLKLDVSAKDKEVIKSKEQLKEHQANEIYQKNEVKRYLTTAREGMERERQDRYLLLVEQNKLKHKVEKLSENCKSYQMKNEELCRIQNELEQECDQFRKLKKIIQEHGLPSHEQLILLQQQTEMCKDDMLSERKDRERAQAQREKMRRDLEILQSRNQSLQEQVYKYQEHIMRLNTGDRRFATNGPTEFLPLNQSGGGSGGGGSGGGGGGRYSRQFSGPAYFNPKIRMDGGPGAMKPHNMNQPVPGNRQGSPVGGTNPNRITNNYQNAMPERGRRQGGYDSGQFDPWQQRTNGIQQQQPQQNMMQRQPRNGAMQNSLGNINRAPRSPLLGPNGDPWYPPNQSPTGMPQQQQPLGQMNNNGFTYPNNIWSQHPPSSPSGFVNKPMQSSPQSSSPSWQYNTEHAGNNFPSPTGSNDHNNNRSAVPGGETWSTVTEDASNLASNSPDYNENEVKDGKESADSTQNVPPIDGFQCGKCNTKCEDTEAFRVHIEKCFN